jgi:hypothetical protein
MEVESTASGTTAALQPPAHAGAALFSAAELPGPRSNALDTLPAAAHTAPVPGAAASSTVDGVGAPHAQGGGDVPPVSEQLEQASTVMAQPTAPVAGPRSALTAEPEGEAITEQAPLTNGLLQQATQDTDSAPVPIPPLTPAQLAANPACHAVLAGECDIITDQFTHAPALREAIQRRDQLQGEFTALLAVATNFAEVAGVGRALKTAGAAVLQQPLSEEGYLTLASRCTALKDQVEAVCEVLDAAENYSALELLGEKFEELNALDVSSLLQGLGVQPAALPFTPDVHAVLQCNELLVLCDTIVVQIGHVPAIRDAIQQRDTLRERVQSALNFAQKGRQGQQLQAAEEVLAQLPLSEADYLTLADRHAALVQAVRTTCLDLAAAGELDALDTLAAKLEKLQALDVSIISRPVAPPAASAISESVSPRSEQQPSSVAAPAPASAVPAQASTETSTQSLTGAATPAADAVAAAYALTGAISQSPLTPPRSEAAAAAASECAPAPPTGGAAPAAVLTPVAADAAEVPVSAPSVTAWQGLTTGATTQPLADAQDTHFDGGGDAADAAWDNSDSSSDLSALSFTSSSGDLHGAAQEQDPVQEGEGGTANADASAAHAEGGDPAFSAPSTAAAHPFPPTSPGFNDFGGSLDESSEYWQDPDQYGADSTLAEMTAVLPSVKSTEGLHESTLLPTDSFEQQQHGEGKAGTGNKNSAPVSRARVSAVHRSGEKFTPTDSAAPARSSVQVSGPSMRASCAARLWRR